MPTSLVSILVGVVLLGLAASITAPSATSAQVLQLDAEAERLQSLLQATYASAVSQQATHAVSYDNLTRTFTAYRADDSTQPATNLGAVIDHLSKQNLTVTIPDSLTISPASDPFFFGGGGAKAYLLLDSWGYPYTVSGSNRFAATQIQFTLTLGGHSRTVSMDPFSARVTVQ